MADQQQGQPLQQQPQPVQQPAQAQPQQPPQAPSQAPLQPQQISQSQQAQQQHQQQQQLQQQIQQQQQQPRVSSVGTVSIQGMVAPQAPTPQPSLAAATNTMRSPSTPIPQLQVIGQPMHGQSYLPQFQGYAQPFMLQNANALAAMQMTQLNLAMQQQQQQQQQQQNRTANGANPGSPGGILSPTAASQMLNFDPAMRRVHTDSQGMLPPTHMSLGNGGGLISSSMSGMMPQAAVGNGSNKGQGNGNKTQAVQGQGQNATAAIASMVAKQPTVLPTQQTAAPPMVLGQIGVFSSQANANLGSNFVPQCTVSTHQGGLRLNQAQMVNTGQIITSQPMQSIFANQAIMQAMANLQQMQQGIPLAAATGHQQLINQSPSQMPTIFAGQNFLIRAQGPLPPQPITMTSMPTAAFTGLKTQQQQQQQPQQQQQTPQQQQAGKVVDRSSQTNVSGKVMLPSVSRTPMTAKIQPSVSQPAKLSVPAVPKTPKSRPKAQPKAAVSTAMVSPSTAAAVAKSAIMATAITTPITTLTTTATSSTAAVVPSLPAAVAAAPTTTTTTTITTTVTAAPTVISVGTAIPIHAGDSETPSPALSRLPVPAAAAAAQALQIKSQSDSEVETAKLQSIPASSTTVDSALRAKIKATVASSSSPTVSVTTTAAAPSLPTSSSGSSSGTSSATKLSPILAGDKMPVDDIEEKPVITEGVVKPAGSTINAAMEAAGLLTRVKESKPITIVEPSPITLQPPPPPVVEKQRAIVKPQILTHIIEGFIIQEGPEPFPVQQSSLLQEFIPPKASLQIVKESEEEGTSYDDEPPTLLSQVDAHLSSTQPFSHLPQELEEKDQEQKKLHVKLMRCELCQKVAPASTFNNSRRFCSLSCSRRHNVSHTRRVGLYKPRGTSRKRKHMLGRKNWRVTKGGRLPYAKNSNNNSNDENNDSNIVALGSEMSSSNSAQDTSSSAASPPRAQDFEMDVDANIPRTDPGKWTVTEVYDFIQSMPGCREYAEEFRSQEIDGQALLLLKEDHLMTAMNIKLGPALKICSKINTLKSECSSV